MHVSRKGRQSTDSTDCYDVGKMILRTIKILRCRVCRATIYHESPWQHRKSKGGISEGFVVWGPLPCQPWDARLLAFVTTPERIHMSWRRCGTEAIFDGPI